ncbi:MAG: carboxypeptidase-like regulatory domain-containing protein, partial [Nitrososphaerota archaeon]
WDRVWLTFTIENVLPRTILVQVPPSPAKLILRNVVDVVDVAVSADYVYCLLTAPARDMNKDTPAVEDKWGESNGILSYGRWYTDADGYVDSFKAFGPADPRYGSIILPTAGWLNETFHDNYTKSKDEFHYQINIVWKSAVVYSDNIVLDKKGYITGPSEVYTVTFYLALSNSTKAPVKGLNAWIYYPNVTEWWSAGLWHTVPPEPQDYEACKDSVFACELRVTLASEAWADGRKTFELIPGPRFMNTTWKYVFSANHTAIDWMDDLVATQFVLNNETFGDGALRVKTTTRIDVPIMLNAARWVVFEVATWRDEAGVPTAYPMKDYVVKYEIRKPKYLSGPALTAASGQATTDAEGKVVLTSDPSDPRKVFWAGMIIRYRVEPPTYTSNYADKFWSDWLKAKGVDFVDKSADYRAPAVPPIMSHAYYPDEEPTHYAIAKIETSWENRTEGGQWCAGLCVHDYRSKPFIVWVDYTAVTVRVTDYNGRPLPGAFVQLWDKASGKIAAWHYTAAKEWEALPLDVAGMIAWHGLDPATDTIKIPFQTKPRMFGGAGFTGVMNVTIGPVAFDTNNDDRIDVNLPCRGIPKCEVKGASSSYITYIARAFWTSTDKKPTDATGALVAVWPYMPNVAQKVYDSEEDEVTWKLLLPRHVAGAAFRPGMVRQFPQVLDSSLYDVTGSLVKEHRDVYAAVFDIKMRFSYEGKPLGDIAKDLEVTFEKAYDVLAFKGKDVVDVKFLPRGTYTVIAKYKGVEVARRTLDLSAVNVGTVTADIPLAMRDVSVQVVDMFGRPLVDASITASPNYYAGMSNVGGVITIRAIVTTQTYEFTVSWKSDVYGTEANTIIADTPDGLAARKVIELPVGDVTITVVDREGKPVGGAKVTIGKATLSTDSEGKAVFQQVPLEKGARGITYDVSVERDGVTIKESITFSRSKTTATLIAELFTLKVRVVGSAGQGLPFAKVIVKRAGVEIGTYTTDAGGFLEVPNLPLADYSVEAEWKGFKGTATATRDDLTKGRAVEISLPPYMEIAGIPFTLAAFLGLVIGLVILVIVIVILIIEYARWRGRRLGIYPPPPPKK